MKDSSPGIGLSIGFLKKNLYLFGNFFIEILNDSEAYYRKPSMRP